MPNTGLIHIVDDDAEIRTSLSSLVRSVGHDARTFGDASEFLGTVLPSVPSCLLLDVRLPGLNGLDFQDNLRQRGVTIPIILMTGFGDIQMCVRAMKAGAIDFLTKPFRHQDVLDAVSAALSRDGERLQREGDASDLRGRFGKLTPREEQVLALVTAGKMNKQVAAELQLSEITVKIHRSSVMKKMQARSLADLVKMSEALKLGIEDRITR